MLSAAVAQLHDLDQLNWRKRDDEQVTITDVTDDFGVLVLAGPLSREVLAQCTKTDLSNASFRWLTGKTATVAGVEGVRLLRVNYVGELGWELHVPMAEMPKVFDALMAAGKPHGIRLFGTYAMNSLRMEKSYRGWGSELTTEIDMIEASMERFLRLDKEDFIGKAATLSQQAARPAHEARLHGGRQHRLATAWATSRSITAARWWASPPRAASATRRASRWPSPMCRRS